MEDWMDLPSGGNSEAEGCLEDDLFDFKRTHSFHLELFGAVHVEVGSFEPDLVSYLPRGELGGDLFFHSLLGNLVGCLGIVVGRRISPRVNLPGWVGRSCLGEGILRVRIPS